MKTRISYQILSVIIILSSLHGCDKEDIKPISLLQNGTVEEGSNLPNYWWYNPTSSTKYSLTWTDQVAFSPKRALKITSTSGSSDNSSFAFWAQTININLPHGKAVTLKVMIKANLVGQGISIAIRGDDTTYPSGSGEQFSTTENILSISNSFDWKEYSVTLNNVNTSTQSLTIYLILLPTTSGDVYFDDASLTTL